MRSPKGYNDEMHEFTVVDLTPQCEARRQAYYTYELLEQIPGAAELIGFCTGAIWSNPEEFEQALPPGLGELTLRWRALARSAGIMTVRTRDPSPVVLSLSLLVAGLDPDADRATLQAYQQHVIREFHGTCIEPSFDLMDVAQRPMVATVILAPPREEDRWILALLDRCFAAAYFRRLGSPAQVDE